ncbi:uncharacterized protein LOC117646987 [Thrips palmi]|uniref:Uncharacterized protein LOC117646987 n=1 Tax=Thrips palmi TaxID=161013 RepID=A0A6P8ZAT3_THRPL|nr:uncharacterized protein LOC117646987 [Thrips palmi]XP_034244323.1 uncharacterized protein LOC117646987 [Thrips palmi]XP_034244324.1 uncharacterized protein LOC117646987 [Thrips palmi]XP_034244325.1 uncharacterized protein LOC117646987 [Thrips palmi]XP_034244326.1 uncharacterized protein LOC117646987 [Thrips palmi]XP_034244327.1 uncharacterized protein LOC117646987 [Thrips palmi]XP_034244328.1 uncharacterized protein LOC117646987 [Thrips palmi]XP_034244329.1 uncharacterized protein LOC1176
MTDLLALPDDALVRVLALLPPRQLFSLRLMCRRLRDLCLHPNAWRSIRLRGYPKGLLKATLRLAPCLHKIRLPSSNLQAAACAISNTKCVVTKLELAVQTEFEVAWATAIVLKFSALGGLRKISLELFPGAPDALPPLLRMVYSVQDLRVLYVWDYSDAELPPSVWSDLEPRPSLTKLKYEGAPFSFLCLLLETHAATLEEIVLFVDELPTSRLGMMPRLRSLACRPSDDLSQLKSLSSLETLELYVFSEENVCFPGAEEFLLQGPSLRSVSFVSYSSCRVPSSSLLWALAKSPSAPVLERLSLCGVEDVLVAAAIPRFSSLQALTLELDAVPSDDFFRAVSPASTPHLATLELWPHGCPHAMLHDPAVQDVLVKNAGLHLRLLHTPSLKDDCACRWCIWRCHQHELRTHGGLRSAFSAHRRRPGCPRDCRRWP